MNETVNRFLLEGDKLMPEMHLKQPGFTYTARGLFTENKERIQKFMERVNTNYIHQKKDLTKRTKSDRVLRDKSFELKVIENIMDMKED